MKVWDFPDIASYKKRFEGFKSKDNPSPIKPTRGKTNEWSYGTTPERELTDSLTSSKCYLWENPKKRRGCYGATV